MQIYMIHTRQMLAEQVLCILGTLRASQINLVITSKERMAMDLEINLPIACWLPAVGQMRRLPDLLVGSHTFVLPPFSRLLAPAARLRRRRRRVPRLVVTESGLAPRRGRHDGMWVHLGA